MPVYDHFVAARREAIPESYLIPERFSRVADLLRRHGITVERVRGRVAGPLETFTVDSVVRDPLFEGHHPVRLEGRWSEGNETAAAGWYLVRTMQPLGARSHTLAAANPATAAIMPTPADHASVPRKDRANS